jgi:hypothetical protein
MKVARQLSLAILVFVGVIALFGSYHMITDPTDSTLGLPSYLLNGSILSSYAILGWIILVTIGLFSIVTILSILRKANMYSILIMLQGLIICLLVFAEIILAGETFIMQYVFLIAGLGLIGLGFLQNSRKIAVETEKKNHPSPAPRSHHHKHRKHK